MIGTLCNDLPVQKGIAIQFGYTLPIKVVLFPCWLLPSLSPPELEAVVTPLVTPLVTAVAVAVAVESVLSPGQTTVQ